MREKEPDKVVLTQSSHAVNLFDLTKSDQDLVQIQKQPPETCCEHTFKVLAVILIVFTVCLLVIELSGLGWSACLRKNDEKLPTAWYSWKKWFTRSHNGETVTDAYLKHWSKLTLHQKRQELLRATFGEVDLYDVYDLPEPNDNAENDKSATQI